MQIRHTRPEDMDVLLALYENARQFMAQNGNPNQWVKGYPDRAQLEQDMAAGGSYVCTDGERIVGTFFFAVGEEPAYRRIENGQWLNGLPQPPAPEVSPPFAWTGASPSGIISALIPIGTIFPCKEPWPKTATSPAEPSIWRMAPSGSLSKKRRKMNLETKKRTGNFPVLF